jgi:hypothetical protein
LRLRLKLFYFWIPAFAGMTSARRGCDCLKTSQQRLRTEYP